MFFKLAVQNVKKHKMSSFILLMIISLTVFALYWIFGFTNSYTEQTVESELFSNGHLFYQTAFVEKDRVAGEIKKLYGDDIDRVEYKRSVNSIVSSTKQSMTIEISDITDRNKDKVKKYKLNEGRFPEKDDEILLSTSMKAMEGGENRLEVGDVIYVTSFTYDKVVNTLRYTIVGIGVVGDSSLVTKSSMDILVNSNNHYNSFMVYLTPSENLEAISYSINKGIKEMLKDRKIKVETSESFFEELGEIKIMSAVFNALKVIVMIIFFPLAGSVLGAIVWIHCYKRRNELWTYSSMGFKDGKVLQLITYEYLIISIAGLALGVLLGALTSMISESMNGMLIFAFILETMLVAKVKLLEIAFITLFIGLNVVFWIRTPVLKIIKTKPFSY